jgi:hypothetical protein
LSHAESSILNFRRKSWSSNSLRIPFAPPIWFPQILISPAQADETERAQEAITSCNDQAFPYDRKIILPAVHHVNEKNAAACELNLICFRMKLDRVECELLSRKKRGAGLIRIK